MKSVLIIENSNSSLKLNESALAKNDYRLVGEFTRFDIVNRNNRVYTAQEYVPHVNEMMKKKEWGVIYGEFDHPDVFDTSMKYVSHTVENAYYLKEKNIIEGEIRLLNTHYGKDAKALVADGLPLFVSSRSAGITESNGHVKMKQLFTYDIVAEPGFMTAKMSVKSINESLGYTDADKSNMMIVESTRTNLAKLSEKYDRNSNFNIFDLTNESDTNNLFNMNNNDMKTKKQLDEWSKYLISEVEKNNHKILESVNSKNKSFEKDSEKLARLIEENETLKEQLSKVIEYMDYLAETVQVSVDGTKLVTEKTDKLVRYTNFIAEHLDQTMSYTEYLAENLEKTVDFADYLAEHLDQTMDYTDYLAEQVSHTVDFADYLAESLNGTIGFSEYLAENLDVTVGYTHYIAENLSKTIDFTDYIAECIDETLEYSNMIAEKINNNNMISEKIVLADDFKINEKASCATTTKENEEVAKPAKKTIASLKKGNATTTVAVKKEETPKADTNTTKKAEPKADVAKEEEIEVKIEEKLSSKIDILIAEAKKREASKIVRPHFYEFITESDIKSFEQLLDEEKETVITFIEESAGYNSRHDVMKLMRKALEKEVTLEEKLVAGMPSDIVPVWESLDVKTKQSIMSQATFHDLHNNVLIENFWNTRNFDKYTLNESKKTVFSNINNDDVLSDTQLAYFERQFKRLG
jgi:hypothetical protein